MRHRTTSRAVVVVGLILGSGVVLSMIVAWAKRQMADGRTYATASAVVAALATHDAADLRNSVGVLPTTQGTTLSDPESDRLIAWLAQFHNLDPPRDFVAIGVLHDPWSHRFRIVMRSLPGGRILFTVSSAGADGLFGTSDDVVRKSGPENGDPGDSGAGGDQDTARSPHP